MEADANQLKAALQELHRVCKGMDLENQEARPTEEEYLAAMVGAETALGVLDLCKECGLPKWYPACRDVHGRPGVPA